MTRSIQESVRRMCSHRGVVVAVATAAIFAATASAAPAMTLRIGKPALSGRVSITVPLTISCSPFDPSLTLIETTADVSVEQASGTGIARGSGEAFGDILYGPTAWLCDGTDQTVPVTVLADPAGPPFHGGPAVFWASAFAVGGTICGPNCLEEQANQSASAGPATITMH